MPERRAIRDVSFRLDDQSQSQTAASAEGQSPDGGFAGWASVFHRIDKYNTIFAPTAFDRTLADFLKRGFVAGLNHDWDNPIGAPVEARTDPARGLFVRAELVPTEAAADARTLLTHQVSTGRPVIQSLSFGFTVNAFTDYRQADDVKRYWASVGYTPDAEDLDALTAACARDGVRIFTDVTLLEISPVTVPGNRRAQITEARQGPGRDQEIGLRLQLARLDV